ncbi:MULTISPECIES: hypothetical protein [Mycobacterium]|uniref:EfeO-type cupredoxin-like domain-containing protein n=1 Tax=Mycobacterium kiyosense TaxID=2871094 RepID=A0A9P3QAJ8_9MYCO|nr:MULTISPECIES: hypothetical protein [Mycobacterium]BDB42921.1 hypothetical protein IWGMT90018_33670 [Mycobacterium kiyosense]BDE13848.1 hypothetical protein MKCMC460_27080 [Mycobacterium sp. 20KCMC460]GLB83737.1 hypothetical protein SRL2020028_29930 [Mycobacterium kiyosense]GLB91380.1 hypothetical protein SRL2020130_41970 [Mycobacterium kiyosense]GLB97255.1 hypothetical protein SRL2020226_40310 [Mycobacterium kiyosense]
MARILGCLLGALALTCALVGCGGKSPSKPAPQSLVVDITIANGQVTPTNATLHASVGQQINLRVNSDATDELHVHSVPDHKFEVAAAPNQAFQFTVDVPGSVDVELHHLHRTIATIQVQS